MTYIVALKKGKFSAIISDSRVTFERRYASWGTNTALKTGLLFPGCIFGRAGDVKGSSDFIRSARQVFNVRMPLEESWRNFRSFAESYDRSSENHFQILMSSRAYEEPLLYLYDSHHGLTELGSGDDWYSTGSGKELLDTCLRMCMDVNPQSIAKLNEQQEQDFYKDYPYVPCLLLAAQAQGLEKGLLENAGVGGVFHFLRQTGQGDYPQREALYLVVREDAKRKVAALYGYRIAFVGQGLVVEYLKPAGMEGAGPQGSRETAVLYDDASGSPPFDTWNSDQIAQWKDMLWKEINAQPYYYCCGWAAADPDKRKKFGMHFSDGTKFYMQKDGTIDPRLQQGVARILES